MFIDLTSQVNAIARRRGFELLVHARILTYAHPCRELSPPEWPARGSLRGSYGPHRGSEFVVPCRLGQRATGSYRLRPPVRAHALSGIGECGGERTLRTGTASRRYAERFHLARSHQLLRDPAVAPAVAGALVGSRSHGAHAPGDDATETRHATRRGEERASLVGGQPAVRHLVGAIAGAGVSGVAPVPSFVNRIDGAFDRCVVGRRGGLLPHVLHAGQRGAHGGGRFRSGRSRASDRTVLRRHSAGRAASTAARHACACHLRQHATRGRTRCRRAAACVRGLPHPGIRYRRLLRGESGRRRVGDAHRLPTRAVARPSPARGVAGECLHV